MRSPFLPEIFAQSSGFVVFGRSSFSLNSSMHESSRCCDPDAPLAALEEVLDRQLLRPATMFSIMAPELKSLKYRTSLSPSGR